MSAHKRIFMIHHVVLLNAYFRNCTVLIVLLVSISSYLSLSSLSICTALTLNIFCGSSLSLHLSPSLSLSLTLSLSPSLSLSLSLVIPLVCLPFLSLLSYFFDITQVTHSELIHGFTACVVVRLKDSIHLQTSSGELWSPLLIIEPSG